MIQILKITPQKSCAFFFKLKSVSTMHRKVLQCFHWSNVVIWCGGTLTLMCYCFPQCFRSDETSLSDRKYLLTCLGLSKFNNDSVSQLGWHGVPLN